MTHSILIYKSKSKREGFWFLDRTKNRTYNKTVYDSASPTSRCVAASMGAAASSNGALELRALHNKITQSGVQSRRTNMTDLECDRFAPLIEAFFLSPNVDPKALCSPEPTYGSPILFAACKAGGEETLCVVRLLRRVCAGDDRLFKSSLDWRDANGISCLHAARDGKVAAVLLRAGCSRLESRDFISNLTPIQMAARNDNVDLVCVLHAWGATNDGPQNTLVAGMAPTSATDIALWQTVPERPHGNLCWLVLYDLVPLSRFGGIQWLKSSRVGRILRDSKVFDYAADGNIGSGYQTGMRASRLFPNGREAARSAPDTLDINCLPEEFRKAARAYDVCCSGKICISELKKLVRSQQRMKKFEGDTDILVADSARFNSIGGGDTLIQCKQRNLHKDHQPPSLYDTMVTQAPSLDVSTYRTDNVTQTYYVARQVQPGDQRGDPDAVREPAGKASGVCLEYGAESGDVPRWLKLPCTHRSNDPWDGIEYEEVNAPISFNARSTGYKVPKRRDYDYDGEFDRALTSTIRATTAKVGVGGDRTEEERKTLWRPAGNRCAGRITEDDHLCLEKNPKLVPALSDEGAIGDRGRTHPSKFAL